MNFILFIWQLPQNIAGLIVLLVLKISKYNVVKSNDYGVTFYCVSKWNYGVCLGKYIFVGDIFTSYRHVRHEYGHLIQSIIFGPTYLIFVGIPSFVKNIIGRYDAEYNKKYYTRWPEKNADVLGEALK